MRPGVVFLTTNTSTIDAGVTLLGSLDDADLRLRPVAGIEMRFAALINVNDAINVKIFGGGTIDGRGENGGQSTWRCAQYEPRGLRWASTMMRNACDVVVSKSSDVTIENLNLKRSGF